METGVTTAAAQAVLQRRAGHGGAGRWAGISALCSPASHGDTRAAEAELCLS